MISKKETAGKKPKPVRRVAKPSSTAKVASPESAKKKTSSASRASKENLFSESVVAESSEMEIDGKRMGTSVKLSTKKAAEPSISIDDLGALPRSYGDNSIFLVAQDPHWLFTYWDIDISRHPGGPCHLRVESGGGMIDQEIEVPFETRNWYIPVKSAGESYAVEIGFYRSKQWNVIGRSGIVATPRNRISESTQFDFATIPLHLSFQKLVQTIERSFYRENKAGAGHLHSGGAQPQQAKVAFPLEEKERGILTALLGSAFMENLSSVSMSSEDLHAAIRHILNERLGSGELPESIARLQLGQAESSLFSAFSQLKQELTSSSSNASSAGLVERMSFGLTSWVAAALSSWSGAAQGSWSGAAQSSFGAASQGNWSAAAEGSWGATAQGSWSGAAETSWGAAAESSWSSAMETFASGPVSSSWNSGMETSASGLSASWNTLSSWLESTSASWSNVVLSSWSEAGLSSLEQLTSSWENASSSWGASENSSSFSNAVPNEFSRETQISLSGRTHPQASIQIDGCQVPVRPDGSFEHQIVLGPDRKEVPILTTSPSGARPQTSTILLQSEKF